MRSRYSFALFLLSVLITTADSAPKDIASLTSTTTHKASQLNQTKALQRSKRHDALTSSLIEVNPKYAKKEIVEHDNNDVLSKQKNRNKSKKEINKTLKENTSQLKKTLRVVRKYRNAITLVLALFVFRREIGHVLWKLCSSPVYDERTGQVKRVVKQPSTISVLKLLLLLNILRVVMSGKRSSSLPIAILMSTAGMNPLITMAVSKFLSPSNSAYIPPIQQHYTFERINERYHIDTLALRRVLPASVVPKQSTSHANHTLSLSQLANAPNTTAKSVFTGLFNYVHSGSANTEPKYNSTVILLDMTNLDTSVSQMDTIRDKVSFLTSNSARSVLFPDDDNDTKAEVEIVVLLESPGGSAPDYALAAQQLSRLRDTPGFTLTIVVDKVAASGGYMTACMSSPGRLFAAPFAVLGSIGVIGQTINIQKTLEGWGIRPLVFRGGRDKAPIGLIGDITKDGMAKVQNMVDDTHRAFKRHVATARPIIADRIEELATGDVWLGYDAIEVGLIDRLITSDEYISERLAAGARVVKLVQVVKPRYLFQSPSASVSVATYIKKIGTSGLSSMLVMCQDFIKSLLATLEDTSASSLYASSNLVEASSVV